jgi:hypothetical protein
MIFKKKASLSIHKVDMNESFRIHDIIFIPIHEFSYEGEKNFMFAEVEPVGVVQIQNHDVKFLSIQSNETLQTIKEKIPELNRVIESMVKN